MSTERKFLCNVYVVLLNPEVVNTPQIKRRNPKRDPLKPCVYVGLTGLRVDRYFDYRGVKATADTWPPRKYGIRLMPELYEHLNPMPFEKAVHSGGETGGRFESGGIHGHQRCLGQKRAISSGESGAGKGVPPTNISAQSQSGLKLFFWIRLILFVCLHDKHSSMFKMTRSYPNQEQQVVLKPNATYPSYPCHMTHLSPANSPATPCTPIHAMEPTANRPYA